MSGGGVEFSKQEPEPEWSRSQFRGYFVYF